MKSPKDRLRITFGDFKPTQAALLQAEEAVKDARKSLEDKEADARESRHLVEKLNIDVVRLKAMAAPTDMPQVQPD